MCVPDVLHSHRISEGCVYPTLTSPLQRDVKASGLISYFRVADLLIQQDLIFPQELCVCLVGCGTLKISLISVSRPYKLAWKTSFVSEHQPDRPLSL